MIDIKSRVKDIIGELTGIDSSDITYTTKLVSIGIDSLGIVELVMVVEDEFDIVLPEDQYTTIITVQDLVDLVKQEINRSPQHSACGSDLYLDESC